MYLDFLIKHVKMCRELAAKSVFVKANGMSQYVENRTSATDYLNSIASSQIVPIYPYTYIEYYTHFNGVHLDGQVIDTFLEYGAFCHFLKVEDYAGELSNLDGAYWVLQVAIFEGRVRRKDSEYNGYWYGSFEIPISNEGYITKDVQFILSNRIELNIEVANRDYDLPVFHARNAVAMQMLMPLVVLSMFSAKNVELSGIDYPVRDKKQRKALRKHALPEYEFKTLRISTGKAVGMDILGNDLVTHGETVDRRYHAVRGHFREVDSLFGNPKLAGTYFIPSHYRGKVNEGIIEKDYEIQE